MEELTFIIEALQLRATHSRQLATRARSILEKRQSALAERAVRVFEERAAQADKLASDLFLGRLQLERKAGLFGGDIVELLKFTARHSG